MSRSSEAWSHAEVCLWLRTSGFADLTDKFTQHNLVGADLKTIDDNFLQTKLGIADGKKRQDVVSAVAALIRQSSGNTTTGGGSGARGLPARPGPQRGLTVPSSLGVSQPLAPEPDSPLPGGRAHSHSTLQQHKRPSLQHVGTMPINQQRSPLAKTATIQAGSKPSLGVSAQQLMADGTMDCCGWIRKQGGSVRSWKRRYMILKNGCLYYYKDESSSHAQGQFSLEGYRVAAATDTKYQWGLHVVPFDKKKRLYVITFSSEPEMRQWMEKIDAATRAWVNDTPTGAGGGGAAPPPISPRPASTLPGHGHTRQHSGSSAPMPPPGSLRNANSNFVEHDLDDEEGDSEEDEHASPSGIHKRLSSKTSASPEVAPRFSSRPDEEEEEPNDYLQLQEGSIQPPPPSVQLNGGGRPPAASVGAERRGQRYEITDLKKPPMKKQPVQEVDEEADYIYPEVEARDILPASVFQDGMDRDGAEAILKVINITGAYLIRSSSAQPNQRVLSVWTVDRCRHYKVFFDEKLKFSLQRGTHFATLPTLVQHYHATNLPKCDFKLEEPYQGR